MATNHRHSLESRDEYNKVASQLRAVMNLVGCAGSAEDGALHDATIPSACWLAADLLDKLEGLFNEGAAQ